jgi:hypothetical protein
VSITDLLPVRLGFLDRSARRPKHRASDEVERLQRKLAGAELLMGGYRIQLEDLHNEHAETIARIDERHGEIVRGLEEQIAGLERRLNTRVLAEHVIAQTQEIPVITPVVPLHRSPQAKTAPSWAKAD